MPTLTARIETDRAERFLNQFCRHAAAMGGPAGAKAGHVAPGGPGMTASAEWTAAEGVVTFTPGGRCTLAAEETALVIIIEADDEASLRRIRDIVTRDFERFGGRTPLTVRWSHRRRAGWIALGVVLAVVALAVHAGLIGAAVRQGWTLPMLAVVLAAVGVKLVTIVLVRRKTGRRWHHRPAAHGER